MNYFRADFHTTEGEQVMLKVAVSPASEEKAALNMSAELPGWDFEATVDAAREAWNAELSKAKVSTDDPEARTIFYTALYHTMIMPSIFSDLDDPRAEYTIFSLWDTYRAQMPLMTLIHADRCNDITATFYHIFLEQGMSTDKDGQGPCCQIRQQLGTLPRFSGTGQQGDAYPGAFKKLL